jgi:hypothetical protein
MNLEGQVKGEGDHDAQAHQLLNVTLLQGGSLPDHWAYLDGCSTITAFKTNKNLSKLEMIPTGIKINCNAWCPETDGKVQEDKSMVHPQYDSQPHLYA